MRPILYVLGFGIAFALTTAVCFYLGLDLTGSSSAEPMIKNNSTHIEIPISTTSVPNVVVSTTESDSNTQKTTEKGLSPAYSVYSFCFIRACMYIVYNIHLYF